MKNVWVAGAALLLTALPCAGQGITSDTSMGPPAQLMITADRDSVHIVVDGVERGFAPLSLDTLSPGTHYVRAIPPDVEQWLSGSIADSALLAPGGRKSIHFTFSRWYSIVTIPAGAMAYAGDSLMGTTPLMLSAERVPAGDSVLVIRKAGYEETRIQPGHGPRGGIVLSLKPEWQRDETSDTPEQWKNGPSSLRLYLTGGTAILAGATAAYFKIRADNMNSEMRLTGNPAMQPEIHRLDTASAIALAVSQAGILLFSYFLLSE